MRRSHILLSLLVLACNPEVENGINDGKPGHTDNDDTGEESDTDTDADADADADADTDTDTDTDTDPLDVDDDGDGFTENEGDCDDADESSYPEAAEVQDVADNDCDGLTDEDFITLGDVVVGEVMMNPVVASDVTGEWFEVYNRLDFDVQLRNWTVSADDGDTFTIDGDLLVPSGGQAVLAVDGDETTNGGVTASYVYDRADFALSDDTDTIILTMGEAVIFDMNWTSEWDLQEGRSLQLDRQRMRRGEYAVADNWCAADRTFGVGDYGTPAVINRFCTDLDHDADGFVMADDCDDFDASAYPGAPELWDGTDNDCDGIDDNLSESDRTSYVQGVSTDYLGWDTSLTTADFDGDGQLDAVVGGTYVNSGYKGGVFVLDGTDHASWAGDVTTYSDARIDAAGTYGYWGTMGQTQGDVSGDGIPDLFVVGTDTYYSYYYDQIAGSLFSGTNLEDADGDEAYITFTNSASTTWYSKAASHADVDGDGAADVVYGDPRGTSSNRRGWVYLFQSGSLSAGSYDLQDDSDFTFYGDQSNDSLGFGLNVADVDGDGYADFIVGAPFEEVGTTDMGCVHIVAGAAGLSGSATAGYANTTRICGDVADGLLGWNAIPQVADFDDDGTQDLAISAPGADAVYVWYDIASVTGDTDVTTADVTINAANTADAFGFALATGDHDGDGKADLVVGAPDGTQFDSTPNQPGEVYVFAGADMVAGTTDETSASVLITGDSNNLFGASLATGDMDGDGVDDLMVAAPQWSSSYGQVSLFVIP